MLESVSLNTKIDHCVEDSLFANLPEEAIVKIFKQLKFDDLLVCSTVNWQWHSFSHDPHIMKAVIFKRLFTPQDWLLQFNDFSLSQSEIKKAWDSLPLKIGQIYQMESPEFPGKKFGEAHDFIWISEGITLGKYGDLLNERFSRHSEDSHYIKSISPDVFEKFKNVPLKKSGWRVISKKTLPQINCSSSDLKRELFIKKFKFLNQECSFPQLLEHVICCTTIFFKFDRKICDYMVECKESIEDNFLNRLVNLKITAGYLNYNGLEICLASENILRHSAGFWLLENS